MRHNRRLTFRIESSPWIQELGAVALWNYAETCKKIKQNAGVVQIKGSKQSVQLQKMMIVCGQACIVFSKKEDIFEIVVCDDETISLNIFRQNKSTGSAMHPVSLRVIGKNNSIHNLQTTSQSSFHHSAFYYRRLSRGEIPNNRFLINRGNIELRRKPLNK